MNTIQAQIKVTISSPMKDYLEGKANQFGIPVAGYIKHLILKDIEDMDYPIYRASKATETAYKKAMKEIEKGKVTSVSNIDTFFEEL